MKITVYTVSNCKFSKQEKEYLQSHNLPFEEKNLETNKDYLKEMLAVSNNFAGTPVTKIEKDDGEIVVLKGFTQEEFDKALGLTPTAAQVQTPSPAEEKTPPAPPAPPAPQPSQPRQTVAGSPAPTMPPSTSPSQTPPPPPSPTTPTTPPAPQPTGQQSQPASPNLPTENQPQPSPPKPLTPASQKPAEPNKEEVDQLLKELQEKTAQLGQEVSSSANKVVPSPQTPTPPPKTNPSQETSPPTPPSAGSPPSSQSQGNQSIPNIPDFKDQ